MSFLACPRTRGNRGPPARLSRQGVARAGNEAEGRSPQPHPALWPRTALPARPRRPPGGGLSTRSRPRPGPAYPGRCSPHTPPLSAPSGTSSAATRPQSSGPAWGARAAGPGGGGPRWRPLLPGPAPARPRLGSAPRPTDRPLGWPGTRRARLPARPRAPSAPRRPAPPRRHSRSLSPPLARLPAAPAGSSTGPAHRGRGGPHTRPARRASWRKEAGSEGGRGRGYLKGPRSLPGSSGQRRLRPWPLRRRFPDPEAV